MKKLKTEEEIVEIPTPKKEIGMLSASFGQEDLNKMVDKINEIILHMNNMI